MKKYFLRFKNSIAKLLLTLLGYTLAASQCLAQYMAIRPRVNIQGTLKGINDTISRFMVVIDKRDTLYAGWGNKYTFEYNKRYKSATDTTEITIEVSEDAETKKQKYARVKETVAIKPEDYKTKEVFIELKQKD